MITPDSYRNLSERQRFKKTVEQLDLALSTYLQPADPFPIGSEIDHSELIEECKLNGWENAVLIEKNTAFFLVLEPFIKDGYAICKGHWGDLSEELLAQIC